MDSLEPTRPEVGEWNEFGEVASAAAAGNLFHSGMVPATNNPWSCAVSPCNRSYGSKVEIMVCCYSTVCRHHSEFFRRHRRVIMG